MRKILFIIISLLLLLGGGIYYMLQFSETPWNIKYSINRIHPEPSYETMRAKMEETAQKNIDLYNTAIRENNAALCKGISIESKKMECLDMTKINIAKKDGNIEACDSISSTGSMILCRDTINSSIALNKGEKKLCENIVNSERKQFCIEGIDDVMLQKHIADKTVTREFCDGLGNKYQSMCLKEIQIVNENDIYREAILANDISLCKKITSTDLRDTCTDSVYLKLATNTENSLLCENIINPEKSNYCKGQLSKNNDITLFKSAISSNSIENCSEIKNTNLHSRCIDTIIFTTVKVQKDITFCDHLTNTGLLSSCQQLGQQ